MSTGWKLQSAVRDTVHIEDSHTAENLATDIMRITDEWGITANVSVITDNASNIVAAI